MKHHPQLWRHTNSSTNDEAKGLCAKLKEMQSWVEVNMILFLYFINFLYKMLTGRYDVFFVIVQVAL